MAANDDPYNYGQLKGQIFTGKYVGIKDTPSGDSRAVFEVNRQGNDGIIAVFQQISQLVGNQASFPFNSINTVDCSE